MIGELNIKWGVKPVSQPKAINEMHQLIKKSTRGDSKAFKQLYDRHAKEFFVVCMRYMSNKHDAEEVLQEGFIKLYRDLYQFDEKKGSFVPWAKRIFVNTALEQLRKKRLIKVELNGYHAIDNFEDQLFDKLGAAEIVKLIMLLPGGYRAVLNLYIIEGYTHQEISEMLDISVNTSKSQLHKAKAKLRNILINQYPEYSNYHVRQARVS